MVEWAAANLIQQERESSQKDGLPNKRSKTSETPEAAIARLTSSYSNAISAMAQLKRSSDSLFQKLQRNSSTSASLKTCTERRLDSHSDAYDGDVEDTILTVMERKNDENKEVAMFKESFDSIKQYSKVARDAFEITLLSDPLIRKFCPTLDSVLEQNKTKDQNVEDATLTSAAHQSALKKLAYASLMNYADLLLSGCSCSRQDVSSNSEKCSILDRGVVPLLQVLQCRELNDPSAAAAAATATATTTSVPFFLQQSLWSQQMMEDEERTKRLALVSYCDACDLDGTDPTIWLKLACAARGYGMVLKSKKQEEMIEECITDYVNLNFERLERYALECGLTALSSNQPPNRALSRAFHEFELERVANNNIACYTTSTKRADDKYDSATLVIHLPRYNWATLGRVLLRACRDGVTSNSRHGWTVQKSWVSKKYNSIEMASPCTFITVSLLLTLPGKVLGKMCSFLEEDDVKRLESTCRSLSVDIVPACALLEKDHLSMVRQMEQEMGDMLQNHEMTQVSTEDSSKNKSTAQNLAISAHRTSQRVRTQLMESGKQAERSAKWKSVEYCLLSSFLPCTTDNPIYKSCLNQDIDWDSLVPLNEYATMIKTMTNSCENIEQNDIEETSLIKGGVETWAAQSVQSEKSSMANFINRWSGNNSGAREVLHGFISHFALFVDSIYDSEKGNSLVLTQCFMECKCIDIYFEFVTNVVRTLISLLRF
jgi:hypothetical protein